MVPYEFLRISHHLGQELDNALVPAAREDEADGQARTRTDLRVKELTAHREERVCPSRRCEALGSRLIARLRVRRVRGNRGGSRTSSLRFRLLLRALFRLLLLASLNVRGCARWEGQLRVIRRNCSTQHHSDRLHCIARSNCPHEAIRHV